MIPPASGSYDDDMAENDPAFLWETEALRSASVPPANPRPASPIGDRETRDRGKGESLDGWLTLRQANEATGIPVPTLRKWAAKGRIPSRLDGSGSGARRLVTLDDVWARARKVGREVEPASRKQADKLDPLPDASPTADETASPPPGTMIVPIAAWDKMLIQLGNLHEAGQQLAEARERAARAETEAMFLRERLAEQRVVRDSSGEIGEGQAEDDELSAIPSFTVYLWKSAVSSLRRRR
jgi:hypothetical protein